MVRSSYQTGGGVMDLDDVWRSIDSERLSLADLLDDLSPAEWETPSLCTGWLVRDVAVHLTQAHLGYRDALVAAVRARGSFDRMIRDAARRTGPPARACNGCRRRTAAGRTRGGRHDPGRGDRRVRTRGDLRHGARGGARADRHGRRRPAAPPGPTDRGRVPGDRGVGVARGVGAREPGGGPAGGRRGPAGAGIPGPGGHRVRGPRPGGPGRRGGDVMERPPPGARAEP